jgi:ferrochelatase
VVEAPRFIWFWVLRLFILPFRPRRVAESYREIWREDSPIREITREQAHKLDQRLPATVDWAMTYGEPALPDVLDRLTDAGHDSILVIPMYPQYSGSTVGAVMDAVAYWVGTRRELPTIQVVRDYWQEPGWQKAVAESIRRFQREHGIPERLLFSFHGIPKSYENKGDRYAQRCRDSAAAIAHHLGLEDGQWHLTFQSRFGPTEWLQPYTDETLMQWASDGIRDVQVACPGFAADCLETLEEICVENRDYFLENGGSRFAYIPALNADDDHIDALEMVARRWLPESNR